MSHDETAGDHALMSIRLVPSHRQPSADELVEMLRTYAEERGSVGQQAMAASPAGSVQWIWGRVLVEEMTGVLAVLDGGGTAAADTARQCVARVRKYH